MEACGDPTKPLIGDNLLMRVVLPMNLRQPASVLFFCREDRCDGFIISGVFAFVLESRSLNRALIKFNFSLGFSQRGSTKVGEMLSWLLAWRSASAAGRWLGVEALIDSMLSLAHSFTGFSALCAGWRHLKHVSGPDL